VELQNSTVFSFHAEVYILAIVIFQIGLICINTRLPLFGFELRFAVNAISSGRSGFEPLNIYIFFTMIAASIIPDFDIFQGSLDFSEKKFLPAAKMMGKIPLGNFSSPIQNIGHIVVGLTHTFQTAVCPA
jgi:hypothetical protein